MLFKITNILTARGIYSNTVYTGEAEDKTIVKAVFPNNAKVSTEMLRIAFMNEYYSRKSASVNVDFKIGDVV